MLRPDALPSLHAAIAASADPVDGWLLFDFRGINPIMAAVVGPEVMGSRRAYAWIPRHGVPVALVHAVDAELWREWPAEWSRVVWVRREELGRELAALIGGKKVAMEYSPAGDIPYGDYVPAGTLELVRASGGVPVSSAELVTRHCSLWTAEDLASHLRAAKVVADIARATLGRIGERARTADPVTEHEVVRWVLEAFDRAGLETISTPSVSYGANAARIHHEATAEGSAAIVPGQLLLFDLWAREPDGIFADQTWMASIGEPSPRAAEAVAAFRENARRFPNSGSTYDSLADSVLALGRDDAAMACFGNAVRVGLANPDEGQTVQGRVIAQASHGRMATLARDPGRTAWAADAIPDRVDQDCLRGSAP